MLDTPLDLLIKRLARLPGLGPRSASRAALYLIKHKEQLMLPLAQALEDSAHNMRACAECGNLDSNDICHICTDHRRDARRLCVIEDVSDLWAIERAGIFTGRYHILGGTLSAIDGRGPEELGIDSLVRRATALTSPNSRPDNTNPSEISEVAGGEVILATSATVDGQTTAHYIAERLAGLPLTLSRLAHGVPVGGELNYLDDGTLAQAMRARQPL
ncbi:MAG: recombination mediator RecR [Pseudomonadota bacterium]|nr:recombination mediator RecR [Pseudomonadota bacterium]